MSETMKAAIFVEPGKMTVEEVPKAMLEQDDDIVIRVVRTCVCGSDLWAERTGRTQPGGSRVHRCGRRGWRGGRIRQARRFRGCAIPVQLRQVPGMQGTAGDR